MVFSDLSLEEQKAFWKKQNELTDKLQSKRKSVDLSQVTSQEEIERIKEVKKKKARELYWNYHRKPNSHPDNWRKI